MPDDKSPQTTIKDRGIQLLVVLGMLVLCLLTFLILGSPKPELLPAIPVGVFVLYLAWFHPVACSIAYCGIVPLETFQAVGASVSVSKGLGALLILVCLTRVLLYRQNLHLLRQPVMKPLALWLCLVLLGLLTTINKASTLGGIKLLLPPLGIFFFTLFCIDTRKRFILALKSYAIGAAVCASLAFFFATRDREGRLVGFGEDPNFFCTFFIAGYAMCATLLMHSKGGLRLFWGLCACTQIGVILQSQSRAGIAVIGLMSMIIFGPLLKHVTTRMLAPIMLALMLGAGTVLVAAPEDLTARFASLFVASGGTKDPSTQRRLSYIPVALNNVARHPLTGSGLNTYPIVFAHSPYAAIWALGEKDIYRYAHNTFLEMFSDLGVIGGLTFLSIFLLCLVRLYLVRSYLLSLGRPVDAALVAGEMYALAGLMLMLLTISNNFGKALWLLTALAAGAPDTFRREADAGEPDSAP